MEWQLLSLLRDGCYFYSNEFRVHTDTSFRLCGYEHPYLFFSLLSLTTSDSYHQSITTLSSQHSLHNIWTVPLSTWIPPLHDMSSYLMDSTRTRAGYLMVGLMAALRHVVYK